MTIQNTVIPAEESTEYDSWQMPDVKEGQVPQAQKSRNGGTKGELVEVNKDEIIYNSITAGQLEEISNQAYEDIREKAYQDGYKQGYDDGNKQGLTEGQETITERSMALSTVIEQLYGYLEGQDDEVERALVNLVVCVSRSVIKRELVIDSSNIQQVIAQAIATLPMDPKNIHIFLNELDHHLLNSQIDIPEQWSLQVDSSLTPGGCRVTTDHSVVDYSLEDQFQQTVDTLVTDRFTELETKNKLHTENELSGQNINPSNVNSADASADS